MKTKVINNKIKAKRKKQAKAEIPSAYLIEAIKESEEDYKKGDYYSFNSVEEAIKFLDNI